MQVVALANDPPIPPRQSVNPPEVLAYFLEEVPEHLDNLQTRIENLPTTIADSYQLQEIYRATFALRGVFGMLGYSSPIVASSGLDDCLQQLAHHPAAADTTTISMLLNLLVLLRQTIQCIAQGIPPTDAEWAELSQQSLSTITQFKEHLTAKGCHFA